MVSVITAIIKNPEDSITISLKNNLSMPVETRMDPATSNNKLINARNKIYL